MRRILAAYLHTALASVHVHKDGVINLPTETLVPVGEELCIVLAVLLSETMGAAPVGALQIDVTDGRKTRASISTRGVKTANGKSLAQRVSVNNTLKLLLRSINLRVVEGRTPGMEWCESEC